MKRKNLIILLSLFFGCGTLGAFKQWTFANSRFQVESAIDSFYNHYPNYKIPEKWKKFDDWDANGYGFLHGKIFYFKSNPEEMYYVTYSQDNGSPYRITMAIRAVCPGNEKWFIGDKISNIEKHRVERRFEDNIIPKLGLNFTNE